jgi:hypothetical protein
VVIILTSFDLQLKYLIVLPGVVLGFELVEVSDVPFAR